MGGEPPPIGARQPAAGDIVVTKVANHYHVGRVEDEGQPWASCPDPGLSRHALTLACQLASGSEQVFLFDRGDWLHHVGPMRRKPYWLG